MATVKNKSKTFLDRFGNKIIVKSNRLYLVLKGEAQQRFLGRIDDEKKELVVHRDREKHLLRFNQSYGFHNEVLRKTKRFTHIRLHDNAGEHNGYAYAVVAELKELNYQFKINIDMKNESNNNPQTEAMPYDAMLSTGWHSVEDRPLFMRDERGHWVCTEDGDGEFIAALETNKGWWIRHCVVEDETGLCVVGDDYNEPAGWSLEDVTHWMPMPSPPACR